MTDGLFVLNGDTVANVVVADPTGLWQPPDGCSTMPIPDGCPAGIGWRFVDGVWVPPVTPVQSDSDQPI